MGGTRFTINNGNYNYFGLPHSNYNRSNAYNQMTPYMMNLCQQRYGFTPWYGLNFGQQQQSFEVKSNFWEELGTMAGTIEANNPGSLKRFGNWCKDTAFPAIGKAATWAWNGIAGLFSKKSSGDSEEA